MNPLFNKKIRCSHCGGNFKKKKVRNKIRYVCSKHDNFGTCIRNPVDEIFLLELLESRFEKEFTKEDVKKEVDYIEVAGSMELEIHLFNQDNIILGKKYLNL